jgi:uncharacterized membrane protein
MASATATVRIERRASDVFALLADAENDPLWRPGVIEIVRVSGDEVGTIYGQKVAGPAGRPVQADIEITAYEPDRILAFRTTTGPVRPHGRYELTAIGDATEVRFTLTAELRGVKRAMGPIVTKTMRSEVANLDRLKSVLEGGHA